MQMLYFQRRNYVWALHELFASWDGDNSSNFFYQEGGIVNDISGKAVDFPMYIVLSKKKQKLFS